MLGWHTCGGFWRCDAETPTGAAIRSAHEGARRRGRHAALGDGRASGAAPRGADADGQHSGLLRTDQADVARNPPLRPEARRLRARRAGEVHGAVGTRLAWLRAAVERPR